MTTIAVKGLTMCSDSQVCRGDMIENLEQTKIYKVKDCLVGVSGGIISSMKFVKWLEDTMTAMRVQEKHTSLCVQIPEDLVEDDFSALVLYPCGKIVQYWDSSTSNQISGDYWALGSGRDYALSAMDAGATAEEAVAIGIKRDVYSGGDIQSMTLEGTEDKAIDEEDTSKKWCFTFTGDGITLNIDKDGYINFGEGNYKSFQQVYELGNHLKSFYVDMCELTEAYSTLGNLSIYNSEYLVCLLDAYIQKLLKDNQ